MFSPDSTQSLQAKVNVLGLLLPSDLGPREIREEI